MDAIGPYRVTGLVARGGAGAVYRALDPRAGRDVAVKVLLAGHGANPAQLQRFLQEGQALARLRHPNVVRVHTLGEDRGRAYLVMDFVPGDTLWDQVQRRGPLPEREAASCLLQLTDAVQHAHDQGILHRDLKPQNVLLAPDGRPLLTDFGLARALGDSPGPTRTGVVLGTPGFMPPEQAFRESGEQPGPAADVYGLGATLYAVLTGAPPHDYDDWSLFLPALAVVDPRPPRELRPELDPQLEAVCLRALAKRPEQRYPSARALGDDLRAFLEGKPTLAGAQLAGRRRRWGLRALGALGALAAAIGLAALGRSGLTPASSSSAAPPSTPAAVTTGTPRPQEDSADAQALKAALADQVQRLASGQGVDVGEALELANQATGGRAVDLIRVRKLRKRGWKEFNRREDSVLALELFDEALELDPRDAQVRAMRALVRFATGDAADQVAELDAAVAEGPAVFEGWLFRGMLALEAGHVEPALADLEQALRLDRDTAVLLARGRARLAAGDPAGALEDLTAAATRDPPGRVTGGLRAWALLEQGSAAALETWLEQELTARPEDAWCLAVRARSATLAGDREAAFADWRAAVRFLPRTLYGGPFYIRLAQRDLCRRLLAQLEASAEAFEDERARTLAGWGERAEAAAAASAAFKPYPRPPR